MTTGTAQLTHCPTCGVKLHRTDLSLCAYCASPLKLGNASAPPAPWACGVFAFDLDLDDRRAHSLSDTDDGARVGVEQSGVAQGGVRRGVAGGSGLSRGEAAFGSGSNQRETSRLRHGGRGG